MKPAPFAPKRSDQLAAMAMSLESGGGEAFVLFSAAEHIDGLESRLRNVLQAALYLRSTMAQAQALLAGERLFGMHAGDDLQEMAKTKIDACLRAVAGMDFVEGG